MCTHTPPPTLPAPPRSVQPDSVLERLPASPAFMLLIVLSEQPQDTALTLNGCAAPQHPQACRSWVAGAKHYGLCPKLGRTANKGALLTLVLILTLQTHLWKESFLPHRP